VIHVIAVKTAKGQNMITANAEQTQTTAVAASDQPKATKKARGGARRAHVAPGKGKSGRRATPPKKAPKSAKKAEKPAARKGSKTAQILELLKRPGGATLQEIMKATEWQPHSVREFISGTLGTKMGLNVESAKGEDGQRTYSLKG
jgi:Protein of unknown function (DUF3489)